MFVPQVPVSIPSYLSRLLAIFGGIELEFKGQLGPGWLADGNLATGMENCVGGYGISTASVELPSGGDV